MVQIPTIQPCSCSSRTFNKLEWDSFSTALLTSVGHVIYKHQVELTAIRDIQASSTPAVEIAFSVVSVSETAMPAAIFAFNNDTIARSAFLASFQRRVQSKGGQTPSDLSVHVRAVSLGTMPHTTDKTPTTIPLNANEQRPLKLKQPKENSSIMLGIGLVLGLPGLSVLCHMIRWSQWCSSSLTGPARVLVNNEEINIQKNRILPMHRKPHARSPRGLTVDIRGMKPRIAA